MVIKLPTTSICDKLGLEGSIIGEPYERSLQIFGSVLDFGLKILFPTNSVSSRLQELFQFDFNCNFSDCFKLKYFSSVLKIQNVAFTMFIPLTLSTFFPAETVAASSKEQDSRKIQQKPNQFSTASPEKPI